MGVARRAEGAKDMTREQRIHERQRSARIHALGGYTRDEYLKTKRERDWLAKERSMRVYVAEAAAIKYGDIAELMLYSDDSAVKAQLTQKLLAEAAEHVEIWEQPMRLEGLEAVKYVGRLYLAEGD